MNISELKTAILLSAAFVVSLFTVGHAAAQGSGWNTTSINITEFSIAPLTIDSTNGTQPVTITVRVTDTERDFWSMYVVFRSPQTGTHIQFSGFSVQDRISGSARDGIYRKTFSFWQYAEAGTWDVSEVFIYDGTLSYYRWRSFFTADLIARGFSTQLTVINNNENVPPEISDFSFTPTTVSGFRTVTVTLRARDEASGIRSIYVKFANPPGCSYYFDECTEISQTITSAERISGNDRDGIYRVSFTVNPNLSAGILYASVSATDAVLNRRVLNTADLAALGYPSQLRIPETTLGGISGKVTTADGHALRNAEVTITDPYGAKRIAITSSFGYFSFAGVAAGATYTVTVNSKRYRFPSRTIDVQNELTNVDLMGLE